MLRLMALWRPDMAHLRRRPNGMDRNADEPKPCRPGSRFGLSPRNTLYYPEYRPATGIFQSILDRATCPTTCPPAAHAAPAATAGWPGSTAPAARARPTAPWPAAW